MTVVDSYNCPLCLYGYRVSYRSLCQECAIKLPKELRQRFVRAWQCRVLDPVAYQESCIGARQWLLDSRAIPNELSQREQDIDRKK